MSRGQANPVVTVTPVVTNGHRSVASAKALQTETVARSRVDDETHETVRFFRGKS